MKKFNKEHYEPKWRDKQAKLKELHEALEAEFAFQRWEREFSEAVKKDEELHDGK